MGAEVRSMRGYCNAWMTEDHGLNHGSSNGSGD
jgi:hypothetical protein